MRFAYNVFKMQLRTMTAVFALAMLAAPTWTHAVPIFADWIDANNGMLGGATVSLAGATSVGTNGTFSGFNSPYFTPPIASTDVFGTFPSSTSITLTFSQPISDLTLHIFQLANTTLNFNHSFILLSSDGDFTTTSNTIRGISTADDDANGSLLFAGPITSLTWFGSNANSGDGVGFQISANVVSEPPLIGLLMLGCWLLAIGWKSRDLKVSFRTMS